TEDVDDVDRLGHRRQVGVAALTEDLVVVALRVDGDHAVALALEVLGHVVAVAPRTRGAADHGPRARLAEHPGDHIVVRLNACHAAPPCACGSAPAAPAAHGGLSPARPATTPSTRGSLRGLWPACEGRCPRRARCARRGVRRSTSPGT